MWPDLELIGVYPSRFSGVYFTGKGVFPFSIPHGILDLSHSPQAHLKPGRYILGFRYDCEATAQVWSNCADVTLVS